MLTLAIDTSTPAVTVGLADVGDVITPRADRVHIDARAHSERLSPLIAEALAEIGATPGDIDAIVAGLGPGPFTGLRVGLATAAALGHALSVPTYGVCSLDAIGAAVVGSSEPFLVATDARRKEIYWAVYTPDGQRAEGPHVDRPGELPASADTRLAVGDGALAYVDVLGRDLLDGPRYPKALALVEAAADRVRAGAPGETLTPLYLRRPDVTVGGRRTRA